MLISIRRATIKSTYSNMNTRLYMTVHKANNANISTK